MTEKLHSTCLHLVGEILNAISSRRILAFLIGTPHISTAKAEIQSLSTSAYGATVIHTEITVPW
jgi:hypothetical protein